jgi:N-acetylglucosaminyldiphosphoundecaprenol N-acetyl-beta-D-mannosaminyltransferase
MIVGYLVRWGRWLFPVLGSIGLLLFVHTLQKFGGFVLPGWGTAVLSVLVGITWLGYVLQLNLLNRIGGWTVVWMGIVILIGTLLSKETVIAYPEQASQAVTRSFDMAWKSIYGADIFKEYSLHQQLMQYAESLSKFDTHRAGQIALFAIFGVVLANCFLFPIDPARRWHYGRRVLLLLIVGLFWSLQVELLQVFSPSRMVAIVDFIESLIGSSIGIVVFALFNILYVTRKKASSNRRFNVLGVGIDAVNMQDCLELFEEIIQGMPSAEQGVANDEGGEVSITTLSSGLRTRLPAMTTAMGVAGIVESRRRQKLQRILNESVLNTPDGMPLVWLGKLFGLRRIERVYGPDLLRDACAYGEEKGWRHYFWGAAPGIVEKLKEVLEQKHPQIQISGICCPPFRPLTQEEEDALVEEVNASDTDIFWIGISTPKQLYFMDHIRDRLRCKIICPVGYAFDVNAGVEKDAPDWIKYSGLQWLHRGIKQPRLWKRYLPDNPVFIIKVFGQIFHLKRFPMFKHERPIRPYTDAEGYPRFPAGCVSLSAMTMESARDRVANWVETGQKHYVNICTADTVVQCYDRPDMAEIVMDAGMATTDGMPLVWLARHFGFEHATRVYGPDLMLELCRLSEEKGYSHYFYGATDEVLAELKTNLMSMFPSLKIAGMYSPPFRPLDESEKEEVAERINEAKPDIVWCGLGTPKQDYWVAEFRPRLNCAAILAVGAAFNFHAGHVRQAPRWMMKSGLEWLFRLGVEPKRLWRRYIIGNPRFIFQTFKQWIRAKHILKRLNRTQ